MSIYRRKGSPHWWFNISVAGRKTRRSTGTADRRQAEEYEETERARLWRVHKLKDGGSVRFTEAAAQWLDALPEKSRYKEESIVNWFEQHLKDEPIGGIDADAVVELREMLAEDGKSKPRIDRYMANLRAILRLAVTNRMLVSAPPVPMHPKKRFRIRWLTHREFDRLYSELPPHLAYAAEFAVLTGLRMRAMLNLTWDRVDLPSRRMWIPGEDMKGKEDHGMPISSDVAKVLEKLKALNPEGERVFQYEGRPIDDCNTSAFKKAAKRAGVLPLRWHDLRHTFASWAVQKGVRLPDLMQLGAWKSYSMVLRYAHLAPDHLAQAAELVTRSGHSASVTRRSDQTQVPDETGGGEGDRTLDLRIANAK